MALGVPWRSGVEKLGMWFALGSGFGTRYTGWSLGIGVLF